MRIGLLTWGSEGDVRPFLALARGLAARGHSVEVGCAAIDGRDWSGAGEGFAVHSIAGRWFTENLPRTGPGLARLMRETNPIPQLRGIVELVMDPVAEQMWSLSRELAGRCDVLACHFLFHPAASAALKADLPLVFVSTVPTTPSRHVPPMGMPSLGPLNPLLWRAAEHVADSIFKPRANALRAREGLPLLKGVYRDGLAQPVLAITAVSPTLYPKPADWGERHLVPGFFDLPGHQAEWSMPPELAEFLAQGAPPLFVGFGSMPIADPDYGKQTLALACEAVRLAGARAIVQAPPSLLGAFPARDELCFVGPAPHAALFPRCAAVVHHGGAGTTQAATLAGRPSVIVAHVTDQFMWGVVLAKLGASPEFLPRRKLTAERLAERLRKVLADPSYTLAAERLGAAMRAERGVAAAVAGIEAYARRGS